MAHNGESDNDDWFNKDDEELLKEVKIAKQNHEEENKDEEKTEYIKPPITNDEIYLLEKRLEAAAKNFTTPSFRKISTVELRKLIQNECALEVFLFAFTQEYSDFFVDQICTSDSVERVALYMRILAIISDLRIPGFHEDLVKNFVKNEKLLEHLRIIATIMFAKKCQGQTQTAAAATAMSIEEFDKFICDIQTLIIQTFKLDVMTDKMYEVLRNVLRLIEQSNSQKLKERPACIEFRGLLKEILTDENLNAEVKNPMEIIPTLEDLHNTTDAFANISLSTYEYENVPEYLNIQRETLRTDFMITLSDVVRKLKETKKYCEIFTADELFFENVQIVLNDDFLNVRRHEMLFVDVNPDRKFTEKDVVGKLSKLKSGTLLCFSTDYEFENLMVALVTYQDAEFTRHGYIAIEILRQYNMGNIYNKHFIMFTSPSFFEPYHNVYNYLRTCCVEDFPMKDILVFEKPNNVTPPYLSDESVFKSEKLNFKPLSDSPPSNLPLNSSQRDAVKQAMMHKFSLIQGPPGTGKTHTSVQLVKLLIENETPKPIVVVAYTNDSLDKFLLKLSKYTSSIARFGSQTKLEEIVKFNVDGGTTQSHLTSPRLKRLYFTINAKFKVAFDELQSIQKEFDGTDEGYQKVFSAQNMVRSILEQLNTIRMMFKYYIVRDRSVIALTTTCAAKMNFLLRLLKCRIVIFEEAAEILESHVLACLTPQIEHVIMIGDHMQLKPYNSYNQHSRSSDLNVSLFERLIIRNILKPTVLTTQYRMHPIIAELLCPEFYKTLHNHESVKHYPNVPDMKANLFFINHSFEETLSKKRCSIYNRAEAEIIVSIASILSNMSEYNCEDIVILSPYIAQVNFIKSLLHYQKEIRVQTVDSFQGLEAKIILLSLVRNNPHGRIGFLAEKNRICVALSRAKHALYIVGGLDLLVSRSYTWRIIKYKLDAHNLIGTDIPFTDEKNEKLRKEATTDYVLEDF